MKKLLLTILLFTSLLLKTNAQNPTIDASVLASGLIIHQVDKGKTDDKILHYYVGYFGTNVLTYELNKTDLPQYLKKSLPFITMLVVSVAKECVDKKFEIRDINATMGGSTISVINYNIDLDKLFYKKKK